MFLKDIEPGAHSTHDWNKRLCGSYIYGYLDGIFDTPSVIWIKAITEYEDTSQAAFENAELYWKIVGDGQPRCCSLSRLFVLSFKPDVGVYNLSKFPIHVSHLPYRQWHFGVTNESLVMRRLNGQNWNFSFESLLPCFNPWYPTLSDAVEMLKEGERKHVAISNRVSILTSGVKKDRFLLLYQFVPIASINNGMWFPSAVGKPFEKVAMEYKDRLLNLL